MNKEKTKAIDPNPASKRRGFELDLHGGELGELVWLDYKNENCGDSKLVLYLRGHQIIGQDWSSWDAPLIAIRKEIEPEGLIPICYGASLAVWPSGMCCDVGGGLAYYMREGKERRKVRIFETRPEAMPSTIRDQEAYYRNVFENCSENSNGILLRKRKRGHK
jgi:hypothetical protein